MSQSGQPLRLRARYVFCDERAPVHHGVITIVDDRITDISADCNDRNCFDLGNTAIIPRVVNAHTHLDLSHNETPVGSSGTPFANWLELILQQRSTERLDPQEAIEQGQSELREQGIAHWGDIVTNAETQLPVDESVSCIRFLELMDRPTWASLEQAAQSADTYLRSPSPSGVTHGLSPHSPYTASIELVARLSRVADAHCAPLAIHLAETIDEQRFLRGERCDLTDFLAERDIKPPRTATSTMDYLVASTHAPQQLFVHGNYLSQNEWVWLGQHSSSSSVCYCPRTHAYFKHPRYPLANAIQCGVRMTLGTDSRASNPDLNLWAEFEFAAAHHTDVSPRELLQMITTNAAQALMLPGTVGRLAESLPANFNLVSLPEHDARDPYELLVEGNLSRRRGSLG